MNIYTRLCLLFILLCSSISLSAQSDLLAQKIDFDVKNRLLKDVLIQLSHQSQIAISAPSNLLPSKRITLHLNNQSVNSILKKVLKGSTIDFKLEEEQIVLFKKAPATSYFTISGYIKEKNSGERLALATVFEKNLRKGISSNEFGFYSISLPKGVNELIFSYTGCQTLSKKLNLKNSIVLDVELDASVLLNEVLVTSKKAVNTISVNTNTASLPVQQLRTIPSLGGESDLIRGLSVLPGITTGPDGFGGIYIRGGNVDQNLFLLDGVPIYYPLHTGGIYSVFDERIIKSAQLYKGDAPARYGGKLSSVLDVQMKEGNQNKLAGHVGIGLITANASLEGPIQKEKSSFIVTLRQSIFHTYLKPLSRHFKERKGDTGQTNHSFTDFNSKVNFAIGKKDQLHLSVYHGKDKFIDDNRSETQQIELTTIEHNQNLDWGNTITALRWNHLFNDKLFANTTLTSSRFHFQSKEFYQESTSASTQEETSPQEDQLFYSLYSSSIVDKSLKIDFNYLPNLMHSVRFGADAIIHNFKPGAFTIDRHSIIPIQDLNNPDSITSYSNNIPTYEYNAYVEDNIRFSDKLRINAGLRTSLLRVQGIQYWSIQPRLSAFYKLNDRLLLQSSFGRSNQNHHLLTTSGVGLPSDLWVPATAKVEPQKAWQSSLGLTKLLKHNLSLDVTAYYKQMNNLIAYQEGSSFLVESIVLNASDWESKVTTGKGESYGIEINLEKSSGRIRGWMNYTWSKSLRQFETLNFGEVYDFKFDRPHSFKITGLYQINPRISVSTNWSYQTGLPTTLPTSEYTFFSSNVFAPTTVLSVGEKNKFRLPDYHRLDIELMLVLDKQNKQLLKIGLYNAYNRKNPLYYRLKEKVDQPGEKEFVQVTLLPILPSLHYSFTF